MKATLPRARSKPYRNMREPPSRDVDQTKFLWLSMLDRVRKTLEATAKMGTLEQTSLESRCGKEGKLEAG